MKQVVRGLFDALGYDIQRKAGPPPEAVRGARIAAVCKAKGIERVPAMPRAQFDALAKPLFPTPTAVPADAPLRHYKDRASAVHNRSIGVYFGVGESAAGPTLTDGHAKSLHPDCVRMICSAVQQVVPTGIRGLSVLDIGCSSGYYCFCLAQAGAGDVTGVDARPEHEDQFRLLQHMTGTPATCRFETLDFERDLERVTEQRDLVLAQGVLYHVYDHPRFVKNLHRLTRKVLILEGACSGRSDEFCRAMMEDPKDLRESIHGPVLYPSLPWMVELAQWAGFRQVAYVDYPADMPASAAHESLWRGMLVCVK